MVIVLVLVLITVVLPFCAFLPFLKYIHYAVLFLPEAIISEFCLDQFKCTKKGHTHTHV